MSTPDDHLLAALIAAHRDAETHAGLLAAARQRRREAAGRLHAGGRSYRWIGEQIGVTAQAVEGFLKYHQRRER